MTKPQRDNISPFGSELRRLRIAVGAGQRELARRGKMAGSYLCNIERGRSAAPSREFAFRLAEALGLDDEQTRGFVELADDSRSKTETAPRFVPKKSVLNLKTVLLEAEELAVRGRVDVHVEAQGIQIILRPISPSPTV